MNHGIKNWRLWCGICIMLIAGISAWAQQRIKTVPSNESTMQSSAMSGSNTFDMSSDRNINREGKTFYIQVEGQKQGKFKGESNSHTGWIEGKFFSYQLNSPIDSSSGNPTGKRHHSPLIIVKPLGGASPLFFSACATNENLKSVILEFTQIDSTGNEKTAYRIRLTNAHVASIHQFTEHGQEMEEISFAFKKIEQTSLLANTMSMDDWD
jgi:type VI secretion system secreted protein Hcp